MQSLFDEAAGCLRITEAAAKVAASAAAAAAWRSGALELREISLPVDSTVAGLPSSLRLVSPTEVPRRRLRGHAGTAPLVHALAHIEFNAINLAWDCIARFPGLPRDYYDDWVDVAAEEAEHFALLRGRLVALGHDYGDFPAHSGLWDMAVKTAGDPLARMALVPRFLEARGLDAAPAMIDKLERAGDAASASIVRRILADEVGHVGVGTRWFRHLCDERGLDPEREFFRLLDVHGAGIPRGALNDGARTRAGFTRTEIAGLERRQSAARPPPGEK
jgi:uncharacterized ferritin-like protein (DUF455 family)